MKKSLITFLLVAGASAHIAQAATVQIRLPERFRVLTDQQFDLRVEASALSNTNATLVVKLDGRAVSLPPPEVTTNNDNAPADADKAWTFRKLSFSTEGVHTIEAVVTDASGSTNQIARVGVQQFSLSPGQGGGSKRSKNIILFIGDAMGTAYRDVARIVAQSTGDRFREGFFDELLAMDQMPVTGMAMTYALDRIVPDSANTATAWASGSKTIDGAVGAFPDNNDFRFNSGDVQGTKQFALDNPRIETLWEYLKRRHGYKTGIVTTSDLADATPAGQGGHSITRSLGYDIARQYVDGVFTNGSPFDVILGGGKERFDARTATNSGDTRNLATELQSAGFTYVTTRSQLNSLPATGAPTGRLLGLFRTGNMNVAYDKLGLVRPADEPAPSFGGFNDQPFLDEMTAKAIATLSKEGGPFVLMVEGASVDKQSHPNHAAGQIWDTIELDKSVAVGRTFAAASNAKKANTLVVTTADHDQSIHILGLVDTAVPGATQNVRSQFGFTSLVGEVDGFPDYTDANSDRYPENTNQYRISVGYRTGGHTGSAVPVTAEGAGALLFLGYYDQTDIFFKMAKALSIDTKQLDSALAEKTATRIIEPNY